MQTRIFRGVETTTFSDENGALVGIYRGTAVCRKLADGRVVLNSGGWKTATTKNRMNQFAATYCDNRYGVIQRDGEWFVMLWKNGGWDEENKIPFYDSIKI